MDSARNSQTMEKKEGSSLVMRTAPNGVSHATWMEQSKGSVLLAEATSSTMAVMVESAGPTVHTLRTTHGHGGCNCAVDGIACNSEQGSGTQPWTRAISISYRRCCRSQDRAGVLEDEQYLLYMARVWVGVKRESRRTMGRIRG